MIPVTKTFFPTWDEFQVLLEGTWASGHLTNHGPLVERLELALARKMGVSHVVCVSSGTLALQLALKAHGVSHEDEVVTTAFSYVATVAAAAWLGAKPVLADVEPQSLCLAPDEALEAITDLTRAIVPVHVYGNPCQVDAFDRISKETGIPVIYDAAHAFDARLANRGSCSVFSFHATKLFHTGEGGAVATNDARVAGQIRALRNFCHQGPDRFSGLGINGKMSELHAAMGLAVFPHVPEIVLGRGLACKAYDAAFRDKGVDNTHRLPGNVAYYPILLKDEQELLAVNARLFAEDILCRRYFHPALSYLPYTQRDRETPVADDAARRVLCLPLWHSLPPEEATRIANLVLEAVR